MWFVNGIVGGNPHLVLKVKCKRLTCFSRKRTSGSVIEVLEKWCCRRSTAVEGGSQIDISGLSFANADLSVQMDEFGTSYMKGTRKSSAGTPKPSQTRLLRCLLCFRCRC
jgi:hypothetical protein